MRYIFPAIFEKSEYGGFTVTFPDIGGATEGDTLEEAFYMAEDALNFALTNMAEDGEEIPYPSNPLNIRLKAGQFLTLIKAEKLPVTA